MEYVEGEGQTIDEAIENALKKLGVTRDKVTVDILSEATKGIFGFGAKKARVRAALRRPLLEPEAEVEAPEPPVEEKRISQEEAEAAAQKGKEVLAEILRLMGFQITIEVKAEEEVVLDIQGDNSGLLIGRKGQTLEALQYLLLRMLGEREGPEIVLDAGNYRERRRKSLEDMALRLGEKAKRQRKSVAMDALSAADRRIVHAALQDDPWLTTKSLGRGAYRRLLIIPEGDRRKKEEDKGPPPTKTGAKDQK